IRARKHLSRRPDQRPLSVFPIWLQHNLAVLSRGRGAMLIGTTLRRGLELRRDRRNWGTGA
ncbi:MAG: hypothetical protein L6R19_10075, partial [Alphaproteobacteria bacterium]|nr:hypothetical protein [Alphaproteobacteria bacterium]